MIRNDFAHSLEMAETRRPRALFYSHDTLGLGHLRRTLLICEGLRSRFQELSTLIVTGSAMAHAMQIPEGVDYIKLPSVLKVDKERYESRSVRMPFEEIWKLRQEIILQTTIQYHPDFFFVDNVPMGMKKEVLRTLSYLRAQQPETRTFLILRDILDDSSSIVPYWIEAGGYEVLEEFYDRIFICGSPGLFDLAREYNFPASVAEKTRFCGYLPRISPNGESQELRRTYCPNGEALVLVTLGGGSDGGKVVENYLAALPRIAQHTPIVSIVFLGPDMSRREAQRLMALSPDTSRVTFLDFCDQPLVYMEAADCVVSMAGYNTVSEILWLKKRAIVIPRTRPRSEQLIRSRLFHRKGMLRMIHPGRLTPENLAEELLQSLATPAPTKVPLSFTGIERMTSELQPYLRNHISRKNEGPAL